MLTQCGLGIEAHSKGCKTSVGNAASGVSSLFEIRKSQELDVVLLVLNTEIPSVPRDEKRCARSKVSNEEVP